jgi:hypothetical protein
MSLLSVALCTQAVWDAGIQHLSFPFRWAVTPMSHRTEWKTEDFEDMSWHDAHVHGFRIVQNEGDDGSAELILDIDYIVEWLRGETHCSFVVAQATLQFHRVSGLKLSLDYVTPGAGMCAFSIAGIKRQPVTAYSSYKWSMVINWPSGKLEFDSPGFTQRTTGPSITQSGQSLVPSQRNIFAISGPSEPL